ncbi:DUF4262 domain-containing protein [Novosphingobium beihaiensis]|uniref:DUF4262 domain-containing protein n=1 Tax=Novosphingobium beihaiensis TaxID=2930389 RepID=A0ABT0BLF3_9SPHN|nr:DUF4262 domain-containing protein [Novosphingobium beihaiensis]MCJ2185534.1 DUF4262 domain-containing protein [Novosphingobium beihaiensis]
MGKLFSRKLDRHEQCVVDNIRDYGCQVQFVFDPDGIQPDFSYSIGFPVSVGQPEVIVYGLRNELMHSMVNEMHRQCADGLVLRDGARVSGLLEGFDCVLRHVTAPAAIKEHLGWAIWYHRNQRSVELGEAYQIVWPGAQQGLFPWEKGCDEYVISQQPALYETSIH